MWPLSRRTAPKHALRLGGGRTLFAETVERILPLIPASRILVVTVPEHVERLAVEAPDIPPANFLLEPIGRGTAAVVGWGALEIRRRSAEAVMACLPADHLIRDAGRFRELLQAAHEAAREGHLVTLGIPAATPDTGYGYLERGEAAESFHGRTAYRVTAFREKPDAAQASEYVAAGRFFWNSGMFVWRADRILEEIAQHMPALSRVLQTLDGALGGPSMGETLRTVWQDLDRQTIDYGVMEKAREVLMLPAPEIGWMDIGTWDRVLEAGPVDPRGNLLIGAQILAEDSTGSLVYRAGPADGSWIVTLGVDRLVVVDTGDVVLICSRDRAEDVRRIVERMSEKAGPEFL